MIEVIVGLIAVLLSLLVSTIYLYQRLKAQKERNSLLVHALHSINNARKAIDAQLKVEEKKNEEVQESISRRDYFD